MTRITLCAVALALIVAITSGCTSTASETGLATHQPNQPAAKPVYIMPNCQTIGEQTLCQWITPGRNFGDESMNPAPTPKPQGIAI